MTGYGRLTGSARRARELAARPRAAALAGAAVCGLLACAAVAVPAAASPAAPGLIAGDTPPGFWYGTDSNYIGIPGSGPYSEPVIGGAYGGYVGMTGNWAHWKGCAGDHTVWSPTDAARAATDQKTYHKGIGTAAYWFMAGPGVDPHYNGTTSEAYSWGEAQAARAISDTNGNVTYPVLFMDVELPGNAPGYTPAPDNGWNSVYTSPCSGTVKSSFVAANVDRADFNGFAAYVVAHSSYKVGVYSEPGIWASIFGTGSPSTLTNTYEWTYTSDTSRLSDPPSGWCLRGTSTCARFFGGISSSSKYALMWQWSGGGGTDNGHGDFDQIDGARTP